jgi:hypothetical protein
MPALTVQPHRRFAKARAFCATFARLEIVVALISAQTATLVTAMQASMNPSFVP